MATPVKIPSAMRQFTGGIDQLTLDGATVGEVLANLKAQQPTFAAKLFKAGTATPTLNRNVLVYLNDEDVRFLQNLETPLKPGDTLSIISAVAGG